MVVATKPAQYRLKSERMKTVTPFVLELGHNAVRELFIWNILSHLLRARPSAKNCPRILTAEKELKAQVFSPSNRFLGLICNVPIKNSHEKELPGSQSGPAHFGMLAGRPWGEFAVLTRRLCSGNYCQLAPPAENTTYSCALHWCPRGLAVVSYPASEQKLQLWKLTIHPTGVLDSATQPER